MDDSSSRHLFTILLLSLGGLVVLSLLPWSSLTNNVVKDFNLFEDLFPSARQTSFATQQVIVDPELEELLNETKVSQESPEEVPADISTENVSEGNAITQPAHPAVEAPIMDGIVLVENYTGSPEMLPNFRQALANSATRTVRVAILGDSFIEGDIFAQDLRNNLQERFGGRGVGFVPMYSEFPGFRQSVRMSGSGWTLKDIRNMSKSDSIRTLSGDYSVSAGSATATYKGASAFETTKSWCRSAVSFISSVEGSITLTADNGIQETYAVSPSSQVQTLVLDAPTTSLSVASDIPELLGLGVYLDNNNGVQVDCMSIRGNSGIGVRRINADLCTQMAEYAPYDLIILEFGINALSAEQTDYTPYGIAMEKSVEKLKSVYPDADIIAMGIADRGIKDGTDIISIPTAPAMTDAQRKFASKSGVFFWDTRAAMGGDGAALEWRNRKLLNADYIHLNHAGGKELASLFTQSLIKAMED